MSVKLTIFTVKRFTFHVMAFKDSFPYYDINFLVKLYNYCKSNALFEEILSTRGHRPGSAFRLTPSSIGTPASTWPKATLYI